MVHDRRARPCGTTRPAQMEQTGTLRQLAGARSLSSFIRNGDSGQTDPCLPSLTGLGGKDYGVDLPVAAYVTVPRSFARRAMICSPPTLRTIGNSSGVGLHVKRKVRSCAAKNLGRSPTPSLVSQDLPIAQIREAVCDSNHRISASATAIMTHRFSRFWGPDLLLPIAERGARFTSRMPPDS